MALNFQLKDIPFSTGIDRKDADLMQPEGSLADITNLKFDSDGRLNLTQEFVVTRSEFVGKELLKVNDELLARPQVSNASTDGSIRGVLRGSALPLPVSKPLQKTQGYSNPANIGFGGNTATISLGGPEVSSLDVLEAVSASSGFVDCIVTTYVGTVPLPFSIVIRDSSTGALYFSTTVSPGVGQVNPRVVYNSVANAFFIFYTDTVASIRCSKITFSGTYVLSAPVTLAGGNVFDVFCEYGSEFICLVDSDAISYRVSKVNLTPTIILSETFTGPATVVSAFKKYNAVNSPYVGAFIVGSNVVLRSCPLDTGTGLSSTSTIVKTDARRVSLGPSNIGPSINNMALAIEISADSGAGPLTNRARIEVFHRNELGAPLVAGGGNVLNRGCGLLTRPFVFNSRCYVGVHTASLPTGVTGFVDAQSTLQILDAGSVSSLGTAIGFVQGECLARFLCEDAGRYSSKWTFYIGYTRAIVTPHVDVDVNSLLPTGTVRFAVLKNVGNELDSPVMASLDFVSRRTNSTQVNDLLVSGGACPKVYDGGSETEMGFTQYPIVHSLATGGGGVLPASTAFSVLAVYEWRDARGRTWQSAPSPPVLFTTPVSPGTCIQTNVLTLLATEKTDVNIVIYRTKAGAAGGPFFREGTYSQSTLVTPPTPSYPDTSNRLLLVGQSFSDTQLGPVLQAAGVINGVPEYDCPPPFNISCVFQKRLFFAGIEDPYSVGYTNETFLAENRGLETNDSYRLQVDPSAGGVVALASMDDKLLVLCENRIIYYNGPGPTAAGEGAFSEGAIANSDTGCVSPLTALTPDGLWYESKKGLRLISRGLNLAKTEAGNYQGGAVDALLATLPVPRLRSIIQDSGKNEVQFVVGQSNANTGYILTYDYAWGQWSKEVPPGDGLVSGVYWNGARRILVKNDTFGPFDFYSDNVPNRFAKTASFTVRPITLAGHQGFMRVSHVRLLGTVPRVGTPTVGNMQIIATLNGVAGADGESIAIPSNTFNLGDGRSSPASSGFSPEWNLESQKCSSISFQVLLNFTTIENPLALTSMTMRVGMKRGFHTGRNPQNRRT